MKNNLSSLQWFCFCAFIALVWSSTSLQTFAQNEERTTANLSKMAEKPVGEPVVYKQVGDQNLILYVVKPAHWSAADSRPAMVMFRGGGWTGGSPQALNPQAEHFASKGIVCFNVQYRLLPNQTAPPLVCVQDAKSAMRFVRSRAKEYGIDPNRIGASGGSAGGHLAAVCGIVDGLDDPNDDLTVSAKANALVLFNPVCDTGPSEYAHKIFGDRFQEYSPAHNIRKGAPPTIVFLGTNDKLIPTSTAERFRDTMSKVGSRSALVLYDGAPHGFFNRSPYKEQTLQAADEFLGSLGWICHTADTVSPIP